jgi:GTPase SAR1 family protein
LNSGQNPEIKIVIIGMENAGKTTIVDLLAQATAEVPVKSPDMNPTRSVERRSLFQKNIIIWDFGGQETYRNEYMLNPDKYFHSVSFFYYVVDIQDYYRIASSSMYFMGIFNLIKKHSPDAKIVFLFHKNDPGFDANQKNLKSKFLGVVEPFIQADNKTFTMYDTTIFNLNSIRTAFSPVI